MIKDKRSNGKIFTGKVVSVKMNKTVIVEVTHFKRHPLYKKAVRKTVRHAAANDLTQLAVGDLVTIKEVRPISKTKHFKVVERIKL